MNAEKSLIGSIIIEPHIVELITITPKDFSNKDYSRIFSAIRSLQKQSEKIDLVTIVEELSQLKYDVHASDVSDCVAFVPSASHWQEYENIIKEKSLRRKVENIIVTAKGKIENNTPQDVIAWISKSLYESDISTAEAIPISKLCYNSLSTLVELQSGGKKIGVKTKMLKDNLINGDFIILAARPSMGKTAAAATMILGIDEPVAFFSLEMTANSITNRMIANLSGIPNFSIQNGYLTEPQMKAVGTHYDILSNKEIYICDKAGLSTQEIKSESIRLHRKHGIKAIFIDYLQMIGAEKGEASYSAVTRISGELKALAKYLDVPVVCLSQLSRECEKRSSKKPILSDLRESGAIEQDADMVMLLHSDDYYENKDLMNYDSQIEIAKFRNGRVGTLDFIFQKPEQRFVPK